MISEKVKNQIQVVQGDITKLDCDGIVNGQTLLYQWDSAWNRWIEIGFCTIVNDHGQYDRR